MTDRPIIFSAPMVRALIDGRKTQTRRLLKPQPHKWEAGVIDIKQPVFDDEYQQWGQWETVWDMHSAMWEPEEDIFHPLPLRYNIGDRLYVREAWRVSSAQDHLAGSSLPHPLTVEYPADGKGYFDGRYRHARFMPRWASRLTLTVTDVRIERLQDISEADAIAEGIEPGHNPDTGEVSGWRDYETIHEGRHKGADHPHAIIPYAEAWRSYSSLWGELHTKPGTRWVDNPWIVAVSFEVARGNIDGETTHD